MKYIVIAIAFIIISCNAIFDNDSKTKTVSTEVLDTVKAVPAKLTVSPVLFEAAFIKGTKLEFRKTIYDVYGVNIGKIKISSGYVIACDPMHIDEYGLPFTQEFPTGEFPVHLAIAKLDKEEMIAFARIHFSEEPVAKWEFALQEGQMPIPLKGKKMHGYSNDGGVGIFIDKDAAKVLDKTTVADFNGAAFKEMDRHYRNFWKYCMYDFGQYNLAAFSSGYGDGYYATYTGFDVNGKPCRLITDFDMFKWK